MIKPYICLLFYTITLSVSFAQAVELTPPSTEPNYIVNDNGQGLNRNGKIHRFENWVYPEGSDPLAQWRVDRGFVKPSLIQGLLSNPYHKTGLAMNVYSGVPENYTGHVPVYSEGNYWPYVGEQQILPNNQGVDRDLVQDAGLYFVDGDVVTTDEPLFVKGVDRLSAVNNTDYSFVITAGSFPGTEQPGQVINILNPGQTITVPVAPKGWWPDAVVPETYSSVAGLNPLHIPGWHHSSWSPAEYPGGIQARDFGTPGFAYNLDPNLDDNPGFTEDYIFAGLRTAEGYDPLISGDPGYGLAFYIGDELQAVVDMQKVNDYQAEATLVSKSMHNPANRQQGPITVASAIIAVSPEQKGEYHYLTHDAAQALIAEYRERADWQTITESYQSNPQAVALDPIVDPVLPSDTVIGSTPEPTPSPSPSPLAGNRLTHISGIPSNKTALLIGQNSWNEYQAYTEHFQAPAGASHYGSIYSGTVRGGMGSDTDSHSQFHFNNVSDHYPHAYSLIALNIKDNPAEGGFQSVTDALKGIVDGKLDTQIERIATTMNNLPEQHFMLRIGYEVSVSLFGNSSNYKDAFNYIAQRIREHHQVANVSFVYHPIYFQQDVEALYPGDEYVDFVGFSIFNSAVCMPLANQTFCNPEDTVHPNLKASLEWVKQRGKAFIIPEAAPRVPAVHSEEGFNEYLSRLFHIVETYDARVLAYISTDWIEQGWPSQEWGNSQLDRFTAVADSWSNTMEQARFIHYADLPIQATSSPEPSPSVMPAARPPTVSENCVAGSINFREAALGAFADQDLQGEYDILDDGCTLVLSGNTWKLANRITHRMTRNTVLEFEYFTAQPGEIQGVLLDTENPITGNGGRTFNLSGYDDWGIQDYRESSRDRYITVRIPVGLYFAGYTMYIGFVNDDDANQQAVAHFRNVRFLEE